MTRLSSNRADATQQPVGNPEFNAYLIDEDFDDFLDRQIADLRESPADFRNS